MHPPDTSFEMGKRDPETCAARRMTRKLLYLICLILSAFWAPISHAAGSEKFSNPALTAKLISVEDGVAPNAGTLSLGLDLELADGWKAYWRSPGEVGFPPEIDWQGSENLAAAEIFWPAPERFTAFGIENFGYHDRVVLPIQVLLESSGKPANLVANVTLLTCAKICVPHDFILNLVIPAGIGIDADAAKLITEFADKIPADPAVSDIVVTSASLDADALIITASTPNAFQSPDVFPEMGYAFTFGKPDIRVSASGKELWAKLPLLARDDTITPLRVTLTDGARAVTAEPKWSTTAAKPPFELLRALPGLSQILTFAAFAFLGGLILNVMPCVLPVLSIKLASVLTHSDRPTNVVRGGFLMSALGVLTFMWALAAGVLILQTYGIRVGWGLQFQSPIFLTIMFMVLAIFAANLFGVFEISLPSRLQSGMANSGGRDGYVGDFATGAFAAVLATPCSAPFLGTAIAFALTGRAVDVVIIFTSLGLGLALPYLLFAARPEWISYLPKPGRWMVIVKWVLGLLLALTAFWLLWVLSSVAGRWVAIAILCLSLVFVFLAAFPSFRALERLSSLTAIAMAALLIAANFASEPIARPSSQNWIAFDRSEIPRLVSEGKTVFVDVTADWCLTCKANKALVLDRQPVVGLLRSDDVVTMQADWTRPDPKIARYLEANNRFGIPFNIVYGPNAPNGILLSEVLSTETIRTALTASRAEN